MKLEYIKANGQYHRPQKAGEKDKSRIIGNLPVRTIKQLLFGRWKIDYFDIDIQFEIKGSYSNGDEDTPNIRLILYPSGIEEIVWVKELIKQVD